MWLLRLVAAVSFLHFHFVSFYFRKSLVNHLYLNFDFFSLNDASFAFNAMIQPIHIEPIPVRPGVLQELLFPLPVSSPASEDVRARILWNEVSKFNSTWTVTAICVIPHDSGRPCSDITPQIFLFHYLPLILWAHLPLSEFIDWSLIQIDR